ncbi:MAG: restriction endonuclease subunit S [Candidatus Thiodiazotropha sp.]|nr:restriction endonuclease subunit S [Candidatus Thiodiazotropha sp.]
MRIVKLKDICDFQKGETGLAKAEPGDYPLVTTGAERKTCNTFQFDTRAVCIPLVSSTGHGHASLKNVHYQEGKFALGTILVALTAKDAQELNIQFLHLYLFQLKDQVLVPLMSGAANVALSVTKIKSVEIPLPSIERQTEIVEQFKSIVLEENQLKDELTHQQVLLKKLRQQILHEAIEGKLTVDWRAANSDVEPASELLKRIAAQKAELVKAKKIKKQKSLPSISDEEKLFELPAGWEWLRIEDFLDYTKKAMITGPFGTALQKSEHRQEGISVFGIESIKNGKFTYRNKIFVSHRKSKELKSFSAIPGDIVISRSGTIDEICVIPNDVKPGLISTNLLRISLNTELIEPQLFCYLFKAKTIVEQLKVLCSGSTRLFLNQKILKALCFPVPHIDEQKAIVDRIDNLSIICDQLEAQISESQTHADALMQAVLREAFTQNSAEAVHVE